MDTFHPVINYLVGKYIDNEVFRYKIKKDKRITKTLLIKAFLAKVKKSSGTEDLRTHTK